MNREEIYNQLVKDHKIWLAAGAYTDDKKNRLANLYAVKNTEIVFLKQKEDNSPLRKIK